MSPPKHLITDKGYLAPLEGWRGVVSMFVVMLHFYGFFAFEPFASYGYLGVDFFFILSGFIIARQYEISIALRSTSFQKFCVKRIARLYPLYIISIGLFMWVNTAILKPHHIDNALDYGHGPTLLWRVFLQLTMLGNLFGMPAPWNSPAWSVSVEWVVNLLYFGLVWHFRRVPGYLLWSSIAICTIYLINLSPHSLSLPIANGMIVNATIARGIVGFALGALLYRYHHRLPGIPFLLLFPLECTLMIACAALLRWHEYPLVVSLDYLLQLIVFPAVITVCLYRRSVTGWFFGLPPFRFLGRISYSIYLLHMPIGYALMYSGKFDLTVPDAGYHFLGIVLVVSTLSYFLVETPLRYLGGRLANRLA
jgi:peptidoglycan/LPS O-acetylase OafA/YrhL